MKATNAPVEKKDRYCLISFAPSSGIGFYELEGEVHKFDLITEEDIVLGEESALVDQHFEFGQIQSGRRFDCRKNLISLAAKEYLRDKKINYYTTLFTQPLNDNLRDETLEILNEPEFRELHFSKQFISALKDIADATLVASTLRRASTLNLTNVKECLNRDLIIVVFIVIFNAWVQENEISGVLRKVAEVGSLLDGNTEAGIIHWRIFVDSTSRDFVIRFGSHRMELAEREFVLQASSIKKRVVLEKRAGDQVGTEVTFTREERAKMPKGTQLIVDLLEEA